MTKHVVGFEHGSGLILLQLDAAPEERLESLNPAERSVASAVLEGKSNKEIAQARGTAVRTVANQVAKVLARCGVTSRAELVRLLAS